jgi:TniQ
MPEAALQADGLVRHPRPHPTESLFGYILRLAEENGYPTPNCILGLLGNRYRGFWSRRIPLSKLAKVAHRDLCELERIAYCFSESKHYVILGHPVPCGELRRLGKVSLCTGCVRSVGFIEAHWDLELMTGCPVHRSLPLSRCPKCHLHLRWMRPGQLECSCGAMLGRVDGPTLPDNEAELLDIIRCKVLRLPVSPESSTGMPISELSALSLAGLLSLMRTLAKFHLQLKSRQQLDDPHTVVTAAAHVLRSFPDNFHKLLWTIGEQSVSKQCSRSVKSQFSDIYFAIFYRFRAGDPPETRDFLASAFLDFAINHWRRGVIHPTLQHRLQKNFPKRFITRKEFGQRFGLGRMTASRVLATKNIPTITIRTRQTTRTLIDLEQLKEPPMIPGKIYRLRTAAAAIGVSMKALTSLLKSGHFEIKYPVRRGWYHEHDLKHFTERLLTLNPSTTSKALPSDCITLYRLSRPTRRHYGAREASAIRALLSGNLRVMGNVDGTVRGLFVSRAEFQQFRKNDRARQSGNARTALEAAKEIRCDRHCIPGLVGLKLLDGWNTPTALRISEQSITRFKKKYVSLASIAREIGTIAVFLMKHCTAEHIPMVVVPSKLARHAFVRLEDRSAVLSFRPLRWWNQQAAEQKQRRTATEQDRLKVLHEVQQGHITEKQAAVELGFSVPWVHQMLVRMRAGEDSGKIFKLSTAAEAIGVTANALRKLRASGHFEVNYHIRRKGYSERDINQFIERLLALNPSATNKSVPPDCITLYQAMHQYRAYHRIGEGGATVIRALLSGELRVMGNIDGTVRGLFVSRSELQQFGKNNRARQNGNARTPSEVAEELRCDRACVCGLVESRLLDGRNTSRGLRISEQSIARFKNRYVSLASIAREIGSSGRALMRHCAAKHIPMIVVKYRYSKNKYAFVRLEDRNGLLSFRSAGWWNQQRSAERKRRLAAKEPDRLKVLHEVKQGHITKKQAAVELGLSVQRVSQLLVRECALHCAV